MILQIKYDINLACKVILQEQLDRLDVPYEITGMGEVRLFRSLSPDQHKELQASIAKYGIEILDNPRNVIVQKIKEVIREMIFKEDKLPDAKISAYIADKLNLSYGYIAKIFSEITYSSIENFIILQRIERAKQLIVEENLTLTEVAWKLNYSSTSHLSTQFKKTTGLTPTAFQRIIEKRNNMNFTSDSN